MMKDDERERVSGVTSKRVGGGSECTEGAASPSPSLSVTLMCSVLIGKSKGVLYFCVVSLHCCGD